MPSVPILLCTSKRLFLYLLKGLFAGAADRARHGRDVALECLAADRASPFFHNANLLEFIFDLLIVYIN